MLTETEITQYRLTLMHELSSLEAEGKAQDDERGIVMLDQQKVGRISRIDALQRQAMAQASNRRRETRRERIALTLKRIDEGEFGFCLECGEAIPSKRLDLDPTAPTCVSCAKS